MTHCEADDDDQPRTHTRCGRVERLALGDGVSMQRGGTPRPECMSGNKN